MPATWILLLLGFGTAFAGSLGGLGGAILLVPVLTLAGVDPRIAAPLGMLSVGAASLAAGPRQLREGLVHHRLGVTLEITASAGAIVGAIIGNTIDQTLLARLLGVVAVATAIAGFRSSGMRNPPSATFNAEPAGEWPGTLGGSYRLGDEIVPYSARRLPLGLGAMAGAGVVSGLAGIGGGFIKTPIMRELMHVPVKVAAATTTFTVGVTAAVGLAVFAGQGRIDADAGAAIVVGGLAGGFAGARLHATLHPRVAKLVVSALLVVVGAILLVTAG